MHEDSVKKLLFVQFKHFKVFHLKQRIELCFAIKLHLQPIYHECVRLYIILYQESADFNLKYLVFTFNMY